MKGDLNIAQFVALQWLISQEIQDKIDLERIRLENTALAFNPNINPKLLQRLFEQRQEEEQPTEWITPTSVEDVNEIISLFDAANQPDNQ